MRVSVSRRSFVGLVLGGAAASLLAACGGGAATPTAAPAKPTEAPKPAATSAPAAAATSAPAKPTEAAKPAAAAQSAPVAKPKSGASLKILVWSHFVPAYDTWLDD